MEYQVDLEAFRGPMDLLLYLVKHNEVDIRDIPIAKIADQFLHTIELLQLIDVDWAGEFLVMAATLAEIKSKLVLPRAEEEEEEEDDPRLELVRQLVEYKKYKDAAALLDAQAGVQQTRLPRVPPPEPAPTAPDQQPLKRVELWDLVSAFGRLMRETAALQTRQIVMDDTPQHVHMERILEELRQRPRVTFTEMFTPPHSRGRLLGIFLAVLELIKGRKVVAEQPEPFGEITVSLAPVEANGG